MEFLTAEEVAKILRCSEWFVYANRKILGGIKIGKLVRFDKEIFESKIKEVMKSGDVQTPGQLELGILEEQSAPERERILDQERSKSGGGRSAKKSQRDEFGIYKYLRQSPKRP